MFTKRIITVSAMSVMALALIAASACGSETKSPGGIEHVADDAVAKVAAQQDEHEPTTIEPVDPGADTVAIGQAVEDGNLENDMIVVLDGAIAVGSEGIPAPTDGTRLNDDELFPNGESRGGADPLDTDNIHELPELEAEPQQDPGDIEISDPLPLVDGVINPDSCENVLPPAPESFTIKTHSATDPAKSDNPAVETMCTAWYASDIHEHSASIALIAMNGEDAALDHYDLLKSQFTQGGIKFEEQQSRNQDWLTARIDQGGIGEMVVVRIGSNLASVHNGPTSDQKEWNGRWMLEIAHSALERMQ